jgi:hypothetical protein
LSPFRRNTHPLIQKGCHNPPQTPKSHDICLKQSDQHQPSQKPVKNMSQMQRLLMHDAVAFYDVFAADILLLVVVITSPSAAVGDTEMRDDINDEGGLSKA